MCLRQFHLFFCTIYRPPIPSTLRPDVYRGGGGQVIVILFIITVYALSVQFFRATQKSPATTVTERVFGGIRRKFCISGVFGFGNAIRPARTKARRDLIQQRGGASEPDCVFERYWRYHRRPLSPRDFVLSHNSPKGLNNGSPGAAKRNPGYRNHPNPTDPAGHTRQLKFSIVSITVKICSSFSA